MIKALLITLALFIYGSCFAEKIDSLKVSPGSPVNNDSVKCIAYISFGSEPNTVDSFRVVKMGQSIEVYAYYKIGGFTVPTWQNDSFSLGILETGKYTIRFHLFSSVQINQLDEDSIVFDVLQWNALVIGNESSQHFSIYPNPSKGFVKVNGSVNIVSLELFNSTGICVLRSSINELNVSGLPSGIYTIRIRDEEGEYETSKIDIQTN